MVFLVRSEEKCLHQTRFGNTEHALDTLDMEHMGNTEDEERKSEDEYTSFSIPLPPLKELLIFPDQYLYTSEKDEEKCE